MRRRYLAFTIAVALAVAAWACGGGSSSTGSTSPSSIATNTTPTVTTLSVSGNAPHIGATSQLTATATLSNGTTQTVTPQASWASSDADVATVNSAGLVTGVNAGSADISATYQNVKALSHLNIIRSAFTISGTVRDGTSNGVLPNINVSSFDSAGVTKTTRTNSSGGYSIGGVAPGVVTMTFSATSYQTTTQSTTVAADRQVDIALPRVDNSPSAPAPVLPQGTWSVTIQTLSDSGPSFCIHQPAVGSTFRVNYGLGWSDDTVMFVPPNPIDWDSFTAKISGDLNFTGTNPPTGSGMGMCAHYVQASSITGSFSPDRKSFTATVTWSFTLDSGQTNTITFSWAGTRQE
jgi:hypothetical protein